MAKGKGKSKGKKGKGSGDKDTKLKPVLEGLALNEMTKNNLRTHVIKLFKEIDREREERNFFMLEREKQFLLWNMILEEISQEKDRARLLEIKFDDAEREKEKEMNVYKQKLRFLMGEQTEKLGRARLSNLYKMKGIQDEIWEIIMILRDSMLEKHRQWRKMLQNMYGILQTLRQNHSDEVKVLRNQFADEIKRMSEATERKADSERQEMDIKNTEILSHLRTAKEEQIDHMLYMHEKQLLEMKTFFNDLEVNNMVVITSFQQEIALKKLNERRLQRTLKETVDKYQALLGPTEQNEFKMIEWANDEEELFKIRTEIEKGRKQLEQNQRYIRLMSCANESMIQKSTYMTKERNTLRDCFTKSIIDGHMRASMGRMVMGLRNRAIQQGFMTETMKKELDQNREPKVCRVLQPIFKKKPFNFNECVFSNSTNGLDPLCQAVQHPKIGRKHFHCDAKESLVNIDEYETTYLPPISNKPHVGIRFIPSYFMDE